MSSKSPLARSEQIRRFWRNYLSLLEKNGIPEAARPWYRRRVQQFLDDSKGKRLRDTRPADVRAHMERIGRTGLADWQFAQTADALRLLFCELLRTSWCDELDWGAYTALSRELSADHPTVARDYGEEVAQDRRSRPPGSPSLMHTFRSRQGDLRARIVRAIRSRAYSIKTEHTYLEWIGRYLAFHGWQDAERLDAQAVSSFLEHLAVNRKVAASTQDVALNALVFLYREVLGRTLELPSYSRAKKARRVPVVLSQGEVARLLDRLEGRNRLMAATMYGTGMRLMECVRLRVQDVDFEYRQIQVRMGKGGKDRVVPLPAGLVDRLREQIGYVRELHQQDLDEGFGAVYLPEALARKYPNAARALGWQYLFPSERKRPFQTAIAPYQIS